MDLSTEINARLEHEPGCRGGGFAWETLEPKAKPGTIRVTADCHGCDATIFDLELPAPPPAGAIVCGPGEPTEGDLEKVEAFAQFLRRNAPDSIPGCDYPDPTRVSTVDGHCRCTVCPRCQHHTGNNHQGHYFTWCKVTGTDREFHFCCPGACELSCPDCQGTGIVYVETDCGGCSGYPGISHEPACGVEPCPRGCEVPTPKEDQA